MLGIVPAEGETTGNQPVTISGTDFRPGATVTLGGIPTTGAIVVTGTEITAITPPGVAGPADVAVTNADSTTGSLPGGFAYFPPAGGTFTLAPVVTGLNFPVAMAFAPDYAVTERIFYTEKSGAVRIVQSGALLPQPFLTVTVTSNGERGLLGICFDPNYASNSHVYIFYDYPGPPVLQRVERWEDSSNTGTNPFTILDNLPCNASNHNGGNLVFGPDGMLYVTLGEDAVPALSDDFTVYPGKILRMNPDGTAPTDNPWYDGSLPRSHFFAMGLRNSFDFGFHPLTGDLFASENGPNVNDEMNLIRSGNHYGWDGAAVSGPRGLPGLTDPLDSFFSPPSLTGVGFNAGYRYPAGFYGDMFVGAWNTGRIYRVEMAPPGYSYGPRSNWLTTAGNVTDVVGGPDGYIYCSTSGGIYRVEYN